MLFVISGKRVSLTESKSPCDEAKEYELVPLDYRDVKTLEDAKGKIWYKDWISGGDHHREESGMIVCDKKTKVKQWVIEISSLDQLLSFQNKYGDIVISDSSPYKEVSKEIIIQGKKG